MTWIVHKNSPDDVDLLGLADLRSIRQEKMSSKGQAEIEEANLKPYGIVIRLQQVCRCSQEAACKKIVRDESAPLVTKSRIVEVMFADRPKDAVERKWLSRLVNVYRWCRTIDSWWS